MHGWMDGWMDGLMDGWMDVFPFSETCSLIGFVPRVYNGPLIRLVSSTSLTH